MNTKYFKINGNNFLTSLTPKGKQQTCLVIPNGVTRIADSALATNVALEYVNLKEIILSNTITTLDRRSFAGCQNLKSITFEEGSQLKTIGSDAFKWCKSLQSITIPPSVEIIDSNAFNHCENLKFITFKKNSQIYYIGAGAFANCISLKQISLPKINHIEEYTFVNCSSLQSIVIPNSVKKIGRNAFTNCKSLKQITIPDSITSINVDAFSNCSPDAKYYVSSEKTKQLLLNSGSFIKSSQIIIQGEK